MRKYSLLTAAALGLVAASSLAPSLAHAACSEPAGRCGEGEGKGIRHASTTDVLSPAIGFNWTSPTYTFSVAGFDVDLRAIAEFGFAFAQLTDPDKGGKQPLYIVDLAKAPLAATWSAETKTITVRRTEGTSDSASLDVRYTVRPNAQIGGDYSLDADPNTWSQLFRYNYDATPLVSDIIGNEDFGIEGAGIHQFKPWALAGISPFLVVGGAIPVNGQPGDPNSALFNMPWAVGDINAGNLAANGSFGVYVRTEPEFLYKTLSVKYGDTELSDDVTVDLPVQAEYGDSVKVPVKVRGGVRIDGAIQARPFLWLNQVRVPIIGTFTVNHTFETTVQSLQRPIAIPAAAGTFMEFDFPSTAEVEIPIPNVKVVQQSAEFSGTVGSEGSTKITIKNEGKAPAKLTFESTGDFTISSQTTEISAGGSFDLTVRANPSEAGTVAGSIEIGTNDPDTPSIKLDVNAEFKDAPPPPNSSSSGSSGSSGNNTDDNDTGNGGNAAADDSSGCGCKTAGVPQSSSLGVLSGLALGAVALLRRRRKN